MQLSLSSNFQTRQKLLQNLKYKLSANFHKIPNKNFQQVKKYSITYHKVYKKSNKFIVMFKQQNYEEIFSSRITNQSIEIIKKFFVFQPSNNHATMKPYSSIMNKNKQASSSVPKKQNPKFPGGFQQCYRSVQNNQDEQQDKSSIMLKSKKAPTNQISSFLLGLTGKINRETQIRLAADRQDVQTNGQSISPERRMNYEEVMANLNKIRKENRAKYASIAPTSSTSNTNSLSNPTQLPILQKRLTSPDQKSNISNSFTPTLSNKSSTPSYSSQQCKDKKTQKVVNSNRVISLTYSSKLMLPLQQPCFAKGYLFYDPQAKQYLQKYQANMLLQAKHKKNLNMITAKNYLIIDRETLCIIAERNSDEQIEIASLTKIMTCYLCLMVCRKYKVDPKQVQARVSQRAEEMPGTSAQLQAGDIISLKDLLYALMLPSGNDASVAIGETVGKIIQKNKKKPSRKTYFETFIYHMNVLAKEIGIEQNYQNTSGLSFNPNFSSPKAITILTAIALKNPEFFQIINRKQHELEIRNQRYGLVRKQAWKNTNKLLWKGWQGVKTGTTQSAGHCLMSCKKNYIISVFNCQTLNKRFTECVKIYEQISALPSFELISLCQTN